MMSTKIVTTTEKIHGQEHTVTTTDRHLDMHLAFYTAMGLLAVLCVWGICRLMKGVKKSGGKV